MKLAPHFFAFSIVCALAAAGCTTSSENKPFVESSSPAVDGGATNESDAATTGDAAEGADGAAAADSAATTSGCSITLSGGMTGSFTCTAAAVWASSNNQGGLALNVKNQPANGLLSISIGFPGEPHTGTYRSTDTGAKGGVTMRQGTSIWVASTGGSSAPQGSYELVLNRVANPLNSSSGKSYDVSGTLTATLAPITASGASNDVAFASSF